MAVDYSQPYWQEHAGQELAEDVRAGLDQRMRSRQQQFEEKYKTDVFKADQAQKTLENNQKAAALAKQYQTQQDYQNAYQSAAASGMPPEQASISAALKVGPALGQGFESAAIRAGSVQPKAPAAGGMPGPMPRVSTIPKPGGFGPATDFPIFDDQNVPRGTMPPTAPGKPMTAFQQAEVDRWGRTDAAKAQGPDTTPPPVDPPEGYIWAMKNGKWSMDKQGQAGLSDEQKFHNQELLQGRIDSYQRQMDAMQTRLDSDSHQMSRAMREAAYKKSGMSPQAAADKVKGEDEKPLAFYRSRIEATQKQLDALLGEKPVEEEAPKAAPAKAKADAMPLPALTSQRRPGATYQTPQGPAQWTGKGWLLVQPDEDTQ